jgi:hypothetical protein
MINFVLQGTQLTAFFSAVDGRRMNNHEAQHQSDNANNSNENGQNSRQIGEINLEDDSEDPFPEISGINGDGSKRFAEISHHSSKGLSQVLQEVNDRSNAKSNVNDKSMSVHLNQLVENEMGDLGQMRIQGSNLQKSRDQQEEVKEESKGRMEDSEKIRQQNVSHQINQDTEKKIEHQILNEQITEQISEQTEFRSEEHNPNDQNYNGLQGQHDPNGNDDLDNSNEHMHQDHPFEITDAMSTIEGTRVWSYKDDFTDVLRKVDQMSIDPLGVLKGIIQFQIQFR